MEQGGPTRIVQAPSEGSDRPERLNLAHRFPLPWSHYVQLLKVQKSEARAFYEAEALRNGWTGPQLERQITTLFYERTLASRQKAAMLRKGAEPRPGDATQKDSAVVHYALDTLPNKVLAAEYRTTLPDEETLAGELERIRKRLETRAGDKSKPRSE